MRLLAIILNFHILFLTVFPMVGTVSLSFKKSVCAEYSCCTKKKVSNSACPINKDCGMGSCNPFMMCCNCNALTSQINLFSAFFVFTEQKYYSIEEVFYFYFQSDCWRPPKKQFYYFLV